MDGANRPVPTARAKRDETGAIQKTNARALGTYFGMGVARDDWDQLKKPKPKDWHGD